MCDYILYFWAEFVYYYMILDQNIFKVNWFIIFVIRLKNLFTSQLSLSSGITMDTETVTYQDERNSIVIL
jgi:hypothetical protein